MSSVCEESERRGRELNETKGVWDLLKNIWYPHIGACYKIVYILRTSSNCTIKLMSYIISIIQLIFKIKQSCI